MNSIFIEELEVLESIYMDDLHTDINDKNAELKITIHPSTADNDSKKFVCLTLVLKLDSKYPSVAPEISLKGARGLSEPHLESISENLQSLAKSRIDESMIFELIEYTKDSLTDNNFPSCMCPICREHFNIEDEFFHSKCYHYFHMECIRTYLKNLKDNDEERPAICPVCRAEMPHDIDLEIENNTVTDESSKTIEFVPSDDHKRWLADCKVIFEKQKRQGGIIDVEQEKSRFHISSSTNSLTSQQNENQMSDTAIVETVSLETTDILENVVPKVNESADKHAANVPPGINASTDKQPMKKFFVGNSSIKENVPARHQNKYFNQKKNYNGHRNNHHYNKGYNRIHNRPNETRNHQGKDLKCASSSSHKDNNSNRDTNIQETICKDKSDKKKIDERYQSYEMHNEQKSRAEVYLVERGPQNKTASVRCSAAGKTKISKDKPHQKRTSDTGSTNHQHNSAPGHSIHSREKYTDSGRKTSTKQKDYGDRDLSSKNIGSTSQQRYKQHRNETSKHSSNKLNSKVGSKSISSQSRVVHADASSKPSSSKT